MKIKKSKNTNKKIIIAIVIIALIALPIGYFIWKNHQSQNSESDTKQDNAIIDKQTKSDKEQLKNLEDNPSSKNQAPNTDQPAPITTNQETGKKQVQMMSSHDIDTTTVYIRGGINNSVEYDGTCAAELTGPNGEKLQKPTTLLQNAATTDCKTISINKNELVKGTWKYKLTYSSNTTGGQSNENTFEIK